MRHKMAIVGCGAMAATYGSRLPMLSDRLEIVATVDPLLARAEAARGWFGASRAVRSVDEVIDEIDCAMVITPHDTHAAIGTALLAAGKHVMMEKPLALTEAEGLDLIAAGERAGRILMAAYPMRFHPLVRTLRDEIAGGLIGEVFQLSLWTEQYTRRVGPDAWLNSAATLGGGQLFSHGCHYVDLMMWLLGEPLRGNHIGTRKGTPWMEGEGTSHVVIEFASGAVGYHFGTWGARGTQLGYTIQAHGTEGLLAVDIIGGRLRHVTSERTRTIAEAERHDKYVQRGVEHFLDVIEGRAQLQADPESALQGLRVIWRLYEAERLGVVADLSGLGFGPATRSADPAVDLDDQ